MSESIPEEVRQKLEEEASKYHTPKKKMPPAEPEEKDIPKVVTGSVIVRKKGFSAKMRDFFQGDDGQSIGEFITWQVVVPALRDLLFEAITAGSERALYKGDVVQECKHQ